jgi:hypothetical protein
LIPKYFSKSTYQKQYYSFMISVVREALYDGNITII